jgi:hypothetical protein
MTWTQLPVLPASMMKLYLGVAERGARRSRASEDAARSVMAPATRPRELLGSRCWEPI